jgi:DNA-binding CsgD family transcriptional regulator
LIEQDAAVAEAVRAVSATLGGPLRLKETVLAVTTERAAASRREARPGGGARREPNVDLSEREVEVLRLAAVGLSNKQIGARLFLSEETIKSHVRHILDKLKAKNRAHAVTLWLLETPAQRVTRLAGGQDDLTATLIAGVGTARAAASGARAAEAVDIFACSCGDLVFGFGECPACERRLIPSQAELDQLAGAGF